jgi:hypothetical protein
MKHTYKLLFTLLLNLTLSVPTYAAVVEEKKLNFSFNSEKLMKGDVYYSFRKVSAKEAKKKFSTIAQIDTLKMLKNSENIVLINKIVYVINKPIGFFDHKQMIDMDFLKHLFEGSKVTPVSEDVFRIKGQKDYRMGIYYDSDDISTLPSPAVIKAVTAARKLDIISQSAPAILFKEYDNGSVDVTSYVTLIENKTLAITYHMAEAKKNSQDLNDDFVKEVMAQRKLIESYKKK